MKLVTFRRGRGRPRAGALIDGDRKVLDLQGAHRLKRGKSQPMLASVLAMAQSADDALELAAGLVRGQARLKAATFARADVTLMAPIPEPPQMRDFLCFEEHLVQAFATARKVRAAGSPDPEAAIREMEAKGILAIPQVWYERPIFYHPNRLNVVGTDSDIEWPAFSTMLDFELEFGCFIGKPGRDISAKNAREHIFGYTIFNDVSARDEQMKEMPGQLGPGKGKDFDTGNVLGPCLVTSDEIGNPYRLKMEVRVNGERWGGGNSKTMRWKFEDCIAHASRSETLFPGEFFGSGTVGSGCGLEQMRFLKPGDVVELEVEGIGTLRNRFVKPGAWGGRRSYETKGDTMRQPARRIITGHDANGRATITIDDSGPNEIEVKGWPGLYVTELWVTGEMPVDNMGTTDQGARPMRHDPTPSGTIFRLVEIPPEKSVAGIDTAAAFAHMGSHNKPRPEDSAKHASMHKTNSVDYLVVISGEMWMVMEEGETLIRQGDCIVQRGTNHAWVNKSDKPCVLAAVLVDASPAP